jgi:hypothetical protein
MAYDYIKRSYAFQPEVGRRVQHTVTKQCGTIAREGRSNQHRVRVKFDGQKFALPCHPGELQFLEG